ncbi:SNF2 family N-terminal domain-containing protein [Mycena sp. CBHHK59/15]|nr:SNF2 family N-terminal domain-containing protein [Mycena sp. CBHHK59/15]
MPANGAGPSAGGSGPGRGPGASGEDVIRKSGKSKGKGKAKSKTARTPTAIPAKIETERAALLAEKQAQLTTVLDKHDTLIREKFHMETFLMMVGYDPETAKQDDSQVFQNYKSQYDLLETAVPVSTSPRKTRSSHGLLSLAGPSIPYPAQGISTSVSAPVARPSPVKSRTKEPIKQKILDAPANSKGKGKEKVEPEPESISVGLARGRVSVREPPKPSLRNLRKRPGAVSDPAETLQPATDTEAIDHPPRKRRKTEAGVDAVVPHGEVSDHNTESISAPVNGRVLRGRASTQDHPQTPKVAESEPRDPTVGGKTVAPLGRVMPHRTAAHRPQISAPPLPHRRTVVSTPQRPPPPQFNSSLGTFLESWIETAGQTFIVSQGSASEEVKRLVETEAVLWERVEDMKRAGKWFGSDLFDAFRSGGADAAGSASGVGTPFDAAVSGNTLDAPSGLNAGPSDTWAAVVRSVIAHVREIRSANTTAISKRKTRGAVVASQIAGKIQAYWDGEAAKLEKGRLVEERRLRGVAKNVMKLVVGEWKKAVFHIREQERLKLEAEELKRGHEHLDAILDHSGQILETQQGDLTRGTSAGRSRSSSDDDEDEEEDEQQSQVEEEQEDDEEEGQEEGIGDDGAGPNDSDVDMEQEEAEVEEDPPDTAVLLGDRAQAPGSPTSSLPHPSTPIEHSKAISQSPSLVPSAQDDDKEHAYDEGDTSSSVAVEDMMREDFSSSPIRPRPSHLAPADSDMTDNAVADSGPSSAHSPIPPLDSMDLGEDAEQEEDIADINSPQPCLRQTPSDEPTTFDPIVSTDSHTPASSSTSDTVAGVEGMPQKDIVCSPALNETDTLSKDASVDVDPAMDVVSEDGKRHMQKEEEEENTEDEEEWKRGQEDKGVEEEQEDVEKEEQEADDDDKDDEEGPPEPEVPAYLRPYAVAPVEWVANKKVIPPLLLRGLLRPYQQSGLEWLASLHVNNLNGILADEMGLGKTIQTIALLAHLACDRGIWGPHLIIVPTSVLLNWEMEFKKFLPGFKILSYHGSTKRRKELRHGWNEKHHFNVCITSYTLASRDALVFKRKPWYYMILDEAHMIKNFKSQRWNTLLMFRSFRRLLLTGTPLQNNLTELWALLQFLMSGSDFVNLKEFGEWFSNPLEKAIEAGSTMDDDTMQRVSKLHTVLRPYLLRRLKQHVEKELPSKYEHLVLCPLSKRQRFLYDEFMSRAHTRDALQSGVYQKIANILMQLRKVCNHPDLFEVRPIVTSFAMTRSAIADFEIKELLLRRRLHNENEVSVNMDLLGFRFIDRQGSSHLAALETRRLDGTTRLPFISEIPDAPPPKDTRTMAGYRAYTAHQRRANTISRWAHIGYLNRLRCNSFPIYSHEVLNIAQRLYQPILPLSAIDMRVRHFETVQLVNAAVKSYASRADEMARIVDKFAFVTPAVVALDMPRIALAGQTLLTPPGFDDVLHRASVKLQIAFPDPSLLQYDCGKLQQLTRLLREKKAGGHRILIFTQMTKILDILEIFLNFHGYLYLRLDGATRIEDRQYITERFNADSRVFCFIASSRSGGVGINLTGADTVVFYDSDFNPQMDRQCEDRAHRIGQIRDVHIYRFVSQHTVEEAMLRKANQKRSLDDLVIQRGEFDWRSLFADDGALATALGEFDDTEDAHAAAVAAREAVVMEGQDKADFALDMDVDGGVGGGAPDALIETATQQLALNEVEEPEEEPEEEGGSIAEYMIAFVQRDYEFFREWRL